MGSGQVKKSKGFEIPERDVAALEKGCAVTAEKVLGSLILKFLRKYISGTVLRQRERESSTLPSVPGLERGFEERERELERGLEGEADRKLERRYHCFPLNCSQHLNCSAGSVVVRVSVSAIAGAYGLVRTCGRISRYF